MQDKELRALVQGAVAGNKQDFERLCACKAKDILYICTQLMGNVQDGEDAAQEVFLQMQKSIGTLRDPQAFVAWCNRLTANVCRRMLHTNRRHSGLSLELLEFEIEEMQLEFLPAAFAEEQEKRVLVLDCMRALPFRYRETLLLFYYENLSTADMAVTLGTNVQNVHKLLHRSRAALKKQIEKRTGEKVDAQPAQTTAPLGMAVVARILQEDAVQSITSEAAARVTGAAATGSAPSATGTATVKAAATSAAAGLGKLSSFALLASAAAVIAAVVIINSSAVSSQTLGYGMPAVPQQQVLQQSTTSGDTSARYVGGGEETNGGQSAGLDFPQSDSPAAPPPQSEKTTGGSGMPSSIAPALPATAQTSASQAESRRPASPPAAASPATPAEPGAPVAGTHEVPSGASADTTSYPHAGTSSQTQNQGDGNKQEPSFENEATLYTGTFQFVTIAGKHLPQYDSHAEGFALYVYEGDTLLAQTTANAEGRFTFTLEDTANDLLAKVEPLYGYGPANGGDVFTITLAPGGTIEPVPFTDTLAPAAVARFYGTDGEELDGELDPAWAMLTVYDTTLTTTQWRVEDTNGNLQLQGIGRYVPLTQLITTDTMVEYILICTITDSAGNTTTLERDFAMLKSK